VFTAGCGVLSLRTCIPAAAAVFVDNDVSILREKILLFIEEKI
jgi:hypothetical protein